MASNTQQQCSWSAAQDVDDALKAARLDQELLSLKTQPRPGI
jgi:hypothetical protein